MLALAKRRRMRDYDAVTLPAACNSPVLITEVGNANMLTKALIDRLINKVYVFPGDRIEIEYATQDFLETKQSEKEV